MELTPWQTFAVFIGVILAIAGFINTVGSAWEKVAAGVRSAREPDEAQNRRISALEDVTQELQREAERLRERIERREDGMTIVYKAMLALLSNGIDGNNREEMMAVKKEIESYLINK